MLSVTSEVHENKHICTSQNATIMGVLVQQKQKISTLKAECNMLWNMVINISKDMHSTASDKKTSVNSAHADLKEEETVCQLKDEMDTRLQNSPPSNAGQEEAFSHHVFH
jgi:hypothetical protein